MRHLSTSLVIVDEVHNLRTNHQAGSEAASALKVFSERLDATFSMPGLTSCKATCSPDTWADKSRAA
jgi:hypothetical protein